MRKDLRTVLAFAATGPEPVREAARRLTAKPKRIASVKPEVVRADERKAAGKEERRAKVAAIREAVFARAGGRCEFCGGNETVVGPLEWHHIIGGGLRRHREAAGTTAAICPCCHRGWEAGNDFVLSWAFLWAREHGSLVALAAIQYRIAKVNEARKALP